MFYLKNIDAVVRAIVNLEKLVFLDQILGRV